jgi:hypothetical protein
MTTSIAAKQDLMSALANYKRWIREGKPPHGGRSDLAQYYYDHYHEHIEPKEGEPGVFRFSIQTYDGPDGDTWWTGEFRELNSGTDVELLHSESVRR